MHLRTLHADEDLVATGHVGTAGDFSHLRASGDGRRCRMMLREDKRAGPLRTSRNWCGYLDKLESHVAGRMPIGATCVLALRTGRVQAGVETKLLVVDHQGQGVTGAGRVGADSLRA